MEIVPIVLTGIVVLMIAVFYYGVLIYRKGKYKELAEALGGSYMEQGPFNAGTIEGIWQGRSYQVAVKKIYKALTTVVRVDVPSSLDMTLGVKFFANYPQWEEAHKWTTEKSLMSLPRMVPLDPEDKAFLVERLGDGGLAAQIAASMGEAKAADIRVEKDHVQIILSGVVKDRRRIEASLNALAWVSDALT